MCRQDEELKPQHPHRSILKTQNTMAWLDVATEAFFVIYYSLLWMFFTALYLVVKILQFTALPIHTAWKVLRFVLAPVTYTLRCVGRPTRGHKFDCGFADVRSNTNLQIGLFACFHHSEQHAPFDGQFCVTQLTLLSKDCH